MATIQMAKKDDDKEFLFLFSSFPKRKLSKVEAIMAQAEILRGEILRAQTSIGANRGAGEDGQYKNNSRGPSFATNSIVVKKPRFYDGPLYSD